MHVISPKVLWYFSAIAGTIETKLAGERNAWDQDPDQDENIVDHDQDDHRVVAEPWEPVREAITHCRGTIYYLPDDKAIQKCGLIIPGTVLEIPQVP